MVEFNDKIVWIKMKDLKEGTYKAKRFKIIDDLGEEDDKFNPGKKKLVIHMIEFETGIKYNANLCNASIYRLMTAWGKQSMNWAGHVVSVQMELVNGKEAIVFSPAPDTPK